MEKRFDVIVVGAGNGGLAAAANTASAGLKTLLLEKHNIPGGCATSFRRGRFEFEPSLHELCSVGTKEKPNSVYKFFDDLGVHINWEYEKGSLFRAIVKGDDGWDVTVSAGMEDFCRSIDKFEPGCYENVRAFFALKPKIDAAVNYIYAMKGKPNGLVMLLKHADFMRVAGHTVEEVMTALGIPERAQNLICTYWGYLGVPTDELNCMHFLNMVHDYVVDGAAMPRHRSHEMSLALIDLIQKNGGEVWYNSEVTRFLYNEDGSVAGVVANGEELYAREVISNVIANNVFNMSDPAVIPEQNLKLANARSFGISVATIYLGLDCTAEELGFKDYTAFIMGHRNPRKQNDNRAEDGLYIVNCLNNVIPESSPEGTCTLFFTIPIFGEDVPKDLRPEDYKKYKNAIAKKYIEDAEKVLGISITPHIEEYSVATPVTFARYLGTPEGTIYGYRLSGWDGLMARIAAEKVDHAIPGLSFCGGHYIRGDGYSCAYIMGDTVGKRVAKRLKGDA
ncbi:MAG: NAD(P)/FAD-dependent oxidoreductase [Oscillospiraceae bacterium]|nr:NAD(P)/FAD-dependent oxidoreductase [Oscillospiraceae bacterium]